MVWDRKSLVVVYAVFLLLLFGTEIKVDKG
jgi:hypothetical protein